MKQIFAMSKILWYFSYKNDRSNNFQSKIFSLNISLIFPTFFTEYQTVQKTFGESGLVRYGIVNRLEGF